MAMPCVVEPSIRTFEIVKPITFPVVVGAGTRMHGPDRDAPGNMYSVQSATRVSSRLPAAKQPMKVWPVPPETFVEWVNPEMKLPRLSVAPAQEIDAPEVQFWAVQSTMPEKLQ